MRRGGEAEPTTFSAHESIRTRSPSHSRSSRRRRTPPDHGLEQGKLSGACKRLNVQFVFASNGHLYVEFDRFTGRTTAPQRLSAFPSPDDLRARYEQGMGFRLDSDAARPLLAPYPGGEAQRRYYQDAAIRAMLEKLAKGESSAAPSPASSEA